VYQIYGPLKHCNSIFYDVRVSTNGTLILKAIMDISSFTDKKRVPTDGDLFYALGETYVLWHKIKEYAHFNYRGAIDVWNHPGEKYGWNFRIKDNRRAILYLLPRESYFKVAFVFGQRATDVIMKSEVSEEIKSVLSSAKAYAEGRGIRIDVKNDTVIKDIKKLIDIKIAY